MFINAITKYLATMPKKHPQQTHKTLIDYNVCLIFNPMMIFGALFGAIISQILPDLIVILMLSVLVIASGVTTAFKAVKSFRAENKLRRENKANQIAPSDQ
jgi:uncharacterized membrane protein YfcA